MAEFGPAKTKREKVKTVQRVTVKGVLTSPFDADPEVGQECLPAVTKTKFNALRKKVMQPALGATDNIWKIRSSSQKSLPAARVQETAK